jgi:hypothetical protein
MFGEAWSVMENIYDSIGTLEEKGSCCRSVEKMSLKRSFEN